MDPQLSKTHLKTLRYKTEIFKLVTKHESLAERKKQNKNKTALKMGSCLKGFFIDAKLRLLILQDWKPEN